MLFKKRQVKDLTDTGRVLAITLGTIFGIGVGTATTYSIYQLGTAVMPNKKAKTAVPDEDDE